MIAGVEGGGTSWKVALARPNPATPGMFTIVDTQKFETTTPAETLGKIHAHLHANRERITAVGIASFGPVDLDRASPTYGFITTTPKPGWKNSDVRGTVMGVGTIFILFFAMRLFESAVAFLRIGFALRALAMHTFFRRETLEKLVAKRRDVEKELLRVAELTAAPVRSKKKNKKKREAVMGCCTGNLAEDILGFALRNNKRGLCSSILPNCRDRKHPTDRFLC